MTLMLEWQLHVARAKRDEIEARIDELLEKIDALTKKNEDVGPFWKEFQMLESRGCAQEQEIMSLSRRIREQGDSG